MLGIRIVEELWLELQDALEIEGTNVEKILGRDLAMLGTKNGRRGSELTKAILDVLELGFILDDVGLVEDDLWWERSKFNRVYLSERYLVRTSEWYIFDIHVHSRFVTCSTWRDFWTRKNIIKHLRIHV